MTLRRGALCRDRERDAYVVVLEILDETADEFLLDAEEGLVLADYSTNADYPRASRVIVAAYLDDVDSDLRERLLELDRDTRGRVARHQLMANDTTAWAFPRPRLWVVHPEEVRA